VTDTIIRAATRADMATVGTLGAMLVREHYEFDPQRFIAATRHTAEGYGEFLGTQLRKRDVCVLVAERDGKIVGYTYATLEPRDWMSLRDNAGVIQDIIIDPEHRGGGVGRKLLDATLAFLQAAGAPRVVLSTAARNEGAQRFFASAGFRPTMIEMTKEL
jgi:ribosomal protein S18 acetylase RimI-like enzyme